MRRKPVEGYQEFLIQPGNKPRYRGVTWCDSCGSKSDECYRCSACGHDLAGKGSTPGHG